MTRTVSPLLEKNFLRACISIKMSYPENVSMRDRVLVGLELNAYYYITWNDKGQSKNFIGVFLGIEQQDGSSCLVFQNNDQDRLYIDSDFYATENNFTKLAQW